MKALVPSHLRDSTLAALGSDAERFDLVAYDQDLRFEADPAGSRAFFRWWLDRDAFERTLDELPDLEWVHTGSVGVDHILTDRFLSKNLVLTNSSGVNAVSMAEWVLASVLAVAKDLRGVFERQRDRVWEKTEEHELAGRRALLIGGGNVAREIAARLIPFGVEPIALTRSGQPHSGFTETQRIDSLHRMLPNADWVIIAVPLTSETENLIGREELELMKPSAVLVNVARGEIVDEVALVHALESGKIGGAILDVFRDEPLPDESSLWTLPNVVVLPHTTWRSPEAKRRQVELFADNLRRFERGDSLVNVVGVSRGY